MRVSTWIHYTLGVGHGIGRSSPVPCDAAAQLGSSRQMHGGGRIPPLEHDRGTFIATLKATVAAFLQVS